MVLGDLVCREITLVITPSHMLLGFADDIDFIKIDRRSVEVADGDKEDRPDH